MAYYTSRPPRPADKDGDPFDGLSMCLPHDPEASQRREARMRQRLWTAAERAEQVKRERPALADVGATTERLRAY